MSTWTQVRWLFARLLVLPEQMIENRSVLLVNPLHLVDVFGHLFHALKCLCNRAPY